jgi:hypothetical protein
LLVLKEDKKALSEIQDSDYACAKAAESLQVDGVGTRMILAFYKGIDGINKSLVTEHLANLKSIRRRNGRHF